MESSDGSSGSGSVPTVGDQGGVGQLVSDNIRGNLSIVGGVLGGAISYAVGLVGTFALFASLEESDGLDTDPQAVAAIDDATGEAFLRTLDQAPENFESILAFAGWIFYNAHGVAINLSDAGAVNLLALTEMGIGPFAAIPALLLFCFGGLIALLKRADGLAGGVVSGSSVLLGYAPLAVFGALYFSLSAGGTTASPQFVPAILLVGIVFPVAAGGFAGLLKGLVIDVFLGGIRSRL